MNKFQVFILVASLFLVGCESEKKRIDILTDSKLSHGLTEDYRSEKWNEFNGDGYKLVVYSSDKREKESKVVCDKVNLKYGYFHEASTTIGKIREVIDESKSLCYRVYLNENKIEAVYIQGGHLYYYLGLN